jgi:hypothetical protein
MNAVCCTSKVASYHCNLAVLYFALKKLGKMPSPSKRYLRVRYTPPHFLSTLLTVLLFQMRAFWFWIPHLSLYLFIKLNTTSELYDRATAACRRSQCQLLRIEGVAWSAQRIPTAVNLGFLDPEPLLFRSSSSSVILTRLSGHRSRPTTSQKIW